MTLFLLGAGLSPFNPFPKNDVIWLPNERALQFGRRGVAYTENSIAPVKAGESSSASGVNATTAKTFCTLEIGLQPRIPYLRGSGTLLVFYTPENPLQFRLMQYHDELLIRRDYRTEQNQIRTVELELEHVFTADEAVLFTITSNPTRTEAYRNGVLADTSGRVGLSCNDFAGQLVLGDSPIADNRWRGKLSALAIYNRELTPEEIRRNYAAFEGGGKIVPSNEGSVIAHYSFAQGSGNTVRNALGPGPDLHIPETFRILHKKFLMMPSEESQDKLDARDIAINIAGFMPFGFLLFAYLSRHRRWKRAAILAILAGAAISVTIEVVQGFIPSRSSGITDIFTNTLGTALGVALFQWQPLQIVAAKMRLLRDV